MPRRIRLKFPEKWHVPNDPKLWITSADARDKLASETVYWISTAVVKDTSRSPRIGNMETEQVLFRD